MTLFVACLVALFVFAATAGLTGSFVIAAVAALAVAPAAGIVIDRRILRSANLSSSPRSLLVVSAIAAAVAFAVLARLTMFIVDPSRTSYSVFPQSNWEVHHSCLTAYYVAAGIVRDAPNVYDLGIYETPGSNPRAPRQPRLLETFRVDQYEYPPPFLLLPRMLLAVTPGFLPLRMIWYGLSGLIVLLGLLVVANQLPPEARGRALLLVPLVIGSIATVNTMQKGNAQLAVIVLSMVAMVLVERKQPVAGGAILAWLTLAKLYPGLLVLYLLVRKEWRAVASAAACSLVFLAITVMDVGWQPFAAFREHFPGLLSGEAFPAFRNPGPISINHSIPGLVFKLKLLGATSLGFREAQLVGTLYMLVVAGVTIVLARRDVREELKPLVWLTIVLLATLRSPFLPQSYAPFPAIWLLTLLYAIAPPPQRRIAYLLGAFLILSVFVPVDSGVDPRVLVFISSIPQALIIALAIVAVRLAITGGRRSIDVTPQMELI